MLKDAGLPVEFWDEAALTHAYLRNRMKAGPTVTRLVNGKETTRRVCPQEAWTKKPVSIDHIRAFGCKAVAHIDPKSHPKDSRKDKFMDRGS